jgi:hypothetical protein
MQSFLLKDILRLFFIASEAFTQLLNCCTILKEEKRDATSAMMKAIERRDNYI